jgi:hypothetical protein
LVPEPNYGVRRREELPIPLLAEQRCHITCLGLENSSLSLLSAEKKMETSLPLVLFPRILDLEEYIKVN